MKEVIKELSISVACLLDDTIYAEELVADIEHIQNLVTKLENLVDPIEKGK
tara:strand:+ start:1104 stop:1256 length:153 start_codon:yes stop_codon:yes gene_type:complete